MLKLLFFINLFLFPPAFSEEVSVESGEESRVAPTLDRQSLVHDSAQCRNAPATATDGDLQSIVASDLQRNILARSYAHILESAYILKSHGILRHQDLTSSHSALQSVKSSCTKYPFQAEVTQKALPLLDAQTSVPVATEAVQVQKRYLVAAVEAQRLKNMIKDNYFHGQERARMMERLGKIMQHYPMAMGGYANAQALAAQMGTGTNLLRERATHPEIEKFLFPNSQGQFETVSPTANAGSSGAQLLNRLLGSERLPEPVLRDLGSSMIQAFRPVLTAMSGLCQSSPCQTIAISPTPIAESLNRMPAATRQTHLNAVCQCKLGKNQSMLPDGITEAAGVGALGTAGLCLFSGVGCGPAIVLGLVATSYANVNVYSSLNNILENQRSSNIARDLPGVAAGDVEQLRSYREGIYRDLGISAAVGVAGYGVLRGANSLVQNHGSTVMNAIRRTTGRPLPVPAGHTVLSRLEGGTITRSVDADGRPVYSMVTPQGIERLRMDQSGLAISAGNDQIRRVAQQEIASGNKSVLFIDVNNLGKVNYFGAGSQAGDAYLANVARTVNDVAGGNATVYRWGGDEFVVVLNTQNPAEVRRISQAISDRVYNHPETREIFRTEKVAAAQRYRDISSATAFEQLPQNFRSQLSMEEQSFAQRNFDRFRGIVLEREGEAIRASAALQPSVSVGSAIPGGNLQTAQQVIAAADQQAGRVKVTYKNLLGEDTSKYTRPSYLPADETRRRPRFLRTRPEALDPAQ
ncbi:MAG: diguanylate cyclase [Bdellovibrionales bacterium]|nr:diguanylate cyclase [Bdellovibrionales bacterium]